MRLWRREDSKIADIKAPLEYHISVESLMENAGSAVARLVRSFYPRKVVIFCGKGNNGGDGFVAARHLFGKCDIEVISLGEKDVDGPSHRNLMSLKAMNVKIHENPSADETEKLLSQADVIVDALLGVGFKGELKQNISDFVQLINAHKDKFKEIKVVAVDIPTGVDADNGSVSKCHIVADTTLTFGRPKVGCLLYPGASASGQIVVDEIGMPQCLLNVGDTYISQASEIAALIPQRPEDSHKGSFGKVAVIAGSEGMMGAAVLTCQSAMRSGCGLVYLLSPGTYFQDIEDDILQVVKVKAESSSSGRLVGLNAEAKDKVNACDVMAIGPGLGFDNDVVEAVCEILLSTDKPAVIDADALNALAKRPEVLSSRRGPLSSVITPHHMELSRLLKTPVEEIRADVLKFAKMASATFNCITVLKGAHTIIAHPDQKAYINTTGNSGMATAGSGDVLTGVIASLVAQGLDLFTASVLGVYVHGLAGDLAALKVSKRSLIAQDVLAHLPEAFIKATSGEVVHKFIGGDFSVNVANK